MADLKGAATAASGKGFGTVAADIASLRAWVVARGGPSLTSLTALHSWIGSYSAPVGGGGGG